MQSAGEMQWTRTDAARRWLTAIGLVAGPVLLVVSVSINFTAPRDSLRADFDSIVAHPELVVVEALLETFGFLVVFASLAGATAPLRGRGGALGLWGTVLLMLGIVGFSLSNATGFTLAEVSQLPGHDAAFATAAALMSSGIAGIAGTVGMLLEIAGQLGMVLVIGGLARGRLIRPWPLLLVLAGLVVNLTVGTMAGTLAADLLLLAVGFWLAAAMLRCSRERWLGLSSATMPQPAKAAALPAQPLTAGQG